MLDAKCKEIRPILKQIDSDFDISFNPHTESYLVTHKDFPFTNIPYGQFTRQTIEHIRKAVYININGNVMEEIDEHNAKVEASKERKFQDLTACMANDIRRPLLNAIDYGR